MAQFWMTLGATTLGGLISAVTALLVARSSAKRDHARMLFDRTERRHDDRKEVYREFASAIRIELNSLGAFMDDNGENAPGDVGVYLEFPRPMHDALLLLEMIAPDDTRDAAAECTELVWKALNGDASIEDARAAEGTVRGLLRRDLLGQP